MEAQKPALAKSALSLLEIESDRFQCTERSGRWATGVKSLDSQLLKQCWSSGKVIGIGSVAGSPLLSAQLIANHLLCTERVFPKPDSPASAFIIAPHDTPFVSTLHEVLLTCNASDPLDLLNSVSLLQYLDLAGLAESLAEVSTDLYRTAFPHRAVLLITGLSTSLAALSHRNTGAVQSNALLASLLRSLTHLSLTQPSLLVLLDLDLDVEPQTTAGNTSNTGRGSGCSSNLTPNPAQSAFSTPSGTVPRLEPPTPSLTLTLDVALDTLILVHSPRPDSIVQGQVQGRGQGQDHVQEPPVVVEVTKDRTGPHTGTWAVW